MESVLLAIVNPLAGLFLAVHTFTIKYTSQVMLEALPAFTSLVTVFCYVRYKRKKAIVTSSKRLDGWLISSAVFLGFTAASKYLYCVVAIAILIDWLFTIKNDGKFQTILTPGVFMGAHRTNRFLYIRSLSMAFTD